MTVPTGRRTRWADHLKSCGSQREARLPEALYAKLSPIPFEYPISLERFDPAAAAV